MICPRWCSCWGHARRLWNLPLHVQPAASQFSCQVGILPGFPFTGHCCLPEISHLWLKFGFVRPVSPVRFHVSSLSLNTRDYWCPETCMPCSGSDLFPRWSCLSHCPSAFPNIRPKVMLLLIIEHLSFCAGASV